MPVHLYGQPADMDPILDIARRHGLVVIEDACQAHGSEYKGRRCGSMGDLGCFSFYPGKNLGAYGEGGAVVTSDAAMARKVRLLRAWGEEVRYEHKYRAFNYRMDGVQGAVLRREAASISRGGPKRAARRRGRIRRQLATTPARMPVERPGVRHVYHVYVVELPDRDAWRARLAEADVQTGVHYPIPVHLQPAYRDLGYDAGRLSRRRGSRGAVLSLPMFPELTTRADRGDRGRRGGADDKPRRPPDHHGAAGVRVVPAVHGEAGRGTGRLGRTGTGRSAPARHTRGTAARLWPRHAHGDTAADARMRRAVWRALAKRFGHGVRISRGALAKHPETFEIGDGVVIGEQAFIQGRFDGRCVIGADIWIGPQSYLDARDLVIEESVGWGPGAKVLGSQHTGQPVDVPVMQTDLGIEPVRMGAWADIGVNAVDAAGRALSGRAPSWAPGPW